MPMIRKTTASESGIIKYNFIRSAKIRILETDDVSLGGVQIS